MNVKKIGGKDNILELEVTGTSAGYMNSLRRAILNEVPVLAVETLEIKTNSSIMYDEMLALRLGLVPLTTTVGDYAVPTEEEFENQDYSAKSSVEFTLKVSGPCIVYAQDLKFKDAKVKPVHPKMPIVKLLEGQEVELQGKAVLGRGKMHAKWAPGLAYYHEVPKLNGKALPAGDERSHVASGALDGVSDDAIEKHTGNFYFRVESWGQVAPKDMITLAFDELNKSLKEFDNALKG